MQAFFFSLALRPPLAIAAIGVGCLLAVTGFVWGQQPFVWPGTGLALALAWAATIDIDRFILPNVITLGLIVAGLGVAATGGPEPLLQHSIGAAAGYGVLAGLAYIYRQYRGRDGLGLGDAKLLGAAGAWLGWTALPIVLLVASVAGMVFVLGHAIIERKLDGARAIPFGPFIAAGFWIMWLMPDLAGIPSLLFAS